MSPRPPHHIVLAFWPISPTTFVALKWSAEGQAERVLEIGGGYGALARIFKLTNSRTRYVIVDLPESLFYAHLFLALNFPDARIGYVADERPVDVASFDFLLVPVQRYMVLQGAQFDLVINTASLQEMPIPTVSFWMIFIQNVIRTRYFYSFNYFLTNKRAYIETSVREANLICPILDPYWRVRHFSINSAHLTIDVDKRNWLEVCVERMPSSSVDPPCVARELFKTAETYPTGSEDWFANVWMASWCDPHPQYIQTMLKGIAFFRDGAHAATPKNYCQPLTIYGRARRKLLGVVLRERAFHYDTSRFTEVEFYRRLRGNPIPS